MNHFVRSADGTHIAYQRLGAGPPLIVVHGGLSTSASWSSVAHRLAHHHEVVLFDRRGRGLSGDGDGPHRLGHEVEDVEALLQLTGPGTGLVGHSFGGAVAAEVALRNPVRNLALYEPAIGVGGTIAPAEFERMERLIAAGEREAALDLGAGALDTAGLVAAAPSRIWPESVLALAPTVPRELRSVTDPGLDVDRYAELDVPTLVLAGTVSPPPMRAGCERLAAAMPEAELRWLDGLGHVAHNAAPDVMAVALLDFLR